MLHHGAEAPGGGRDLRFGLRVQPDHLGVAASFEVEHAARAPAMLVIDDQAAARVGGEGGLAGAREAEEDRGVDCWAYVRRAVPRVPVELRQPVVATREHPLLHLASIEGAAYKQHSPTH